MMEIAKSALTERTRDDGPNINRLGANAAVFAASTVIDLAESKFYRAASAAVFERKTHRLEKELESAVSARSTHPEDQHAVDDLQIKIIRDALRQHKSMESAVEFAEEMLSDELLINHGGNIVLNRLAGKSNAEKKVKYAGALATNISDYANSIIQVFFGDRWIGFKDKDGNPKTFMGMYMAEKSMNFINPFNVEAALRMVSEIPYVGDVLVRIKSNFDKFFKENFAAEIANKTVSKLLLGYHVRNTRDKAVEQAMAAK